MTWTLLIYLTREYLWSQKAILRVFKIPHSLLEYSRYHNLEWLYKLMDVWVKTLKFFCNLSTSVDRIRSIQKFDTLVIWVKYYGIPVLILSNCYLVFGPYCELIYPTTSIISYCRLLCLTKIGALLWVLQKEKSYRCHLVMTLWNRYAHETRFFHEPLTNWDMFMDKCVCISSH